MHFPNRQFLHVHIPFPRFCLDHSIVSPLFYRYLPHEATQPPLAGTRMMSTCHGANRIRDVSKSE